MVFADDRYAIVACTLQVGARFLPLASARKIDRCIAERCGLIEFSAEFFEQRHRLQVILLRSFVLVIDPQHRTHRAEKLSA